MIEPLNKILWQIVWPDGKLVTPINSGCYQLVLYLREKRNIKIGWIGVLNFPPGYYIYTGSHQRALLKRVQRHLAREKKVHWHIDYLTAHPDFVIQNVILFPGNSEECKINRSFQVSNNAVFLHHGFGNGDCRKGCVSHLQYLKKLPYNLFKNWLNKNYCGDLKL